MVHRRDIKSRKMQDRTDINNNIISNKEQIDDRQNRHTQEEKTNRQR